MRGKKVRVLVGAILAGLSVLSFSTPVSAYSATVGSNGTVDLGDIMPTPSSGVLSNTASDSVSVTSDCISGYRLYATSTNGGSTALVDSEHGTSIPTSSNTMSSPDALAANTWGLRYSNGDTFSGLPAYNANIASISPIYTGPGRAEAGAYTDTLPIYYGIKVDANTTPGNYFTDVLYTVLMDENCSKYTLNFDGNSATTNNLASRVLKFHDPLDLSTISSTSMIARTGYELIGWKDQAGNDYGITGEADINPGSVDIVTLTAQWQANIHEVTVNNDSHISSVSGAGTHDYDSRVDISASGFDTGYHFGSWSTSSQGVAFNDSTSSSTYFTMPDNDVTVTANSAANTYTINYAAGSTGGSCSGSTSATYDQNVTLASSGCSKSGYYYLRGWSTSSSGSPRTYTLGQTLTAPNFTAEDGGSYTLYPYFEYEEPTYKLTVSNGYLGSSGTSTSGYYAAGTTVTIRASSPGSYYSFSSWSSNNGGSFSNRYSTSTTFTMPSNSVTVTANYSYNPPVTYYTLNVSNGIIGTSGSTTSGSYSSGTGVTITANSPSSGYAFSGWTSSNGGSFANSSSSSTTFYMPSGSTTVTANYVATAPACSSTVHPTATAGCKMADGRTWILGGNGNTRVGKSIFTDVTRTDGHNATIRSDQCPSGYSAPSITVFDSLIRAYGGTSATQDRTGYKESNGALVTDLGQRGPFWSSTEAGGGYMYIMQSNTTTHSLAAYDGTAGYAGLLCYK